ncbi:MAG: PAS domain-containing protein [Planctomycetota bacterium]|jgi:PAS domain-containing protein
MSAESLAVRGIYNLQMDIAGRFVDLDSSARKYLRGRATFEQLGIPGMTWACAQAIAVEAGVWVETHAIEEDRFAIHLLPPRARGQEWAMTITTMSLAVDAQSPLLNVLDSSGEALMALDMRGTIVEWNRAAEQLLGFSRGDILGSPISRLIRKEMT